MSELALPAGYHIRPPTLDDAPAVAALIAAYEFDVFGHSETTEAALIDDWNGVDLTEESLIVRAQNGDIVASADILRQAHANFAVYGYVHPAHRSRGVGTFLVQWGERWVHDRVQTVPDNIQIVMRHFLASADQNARQLLVKQGYSPVRSFYMMGMEFEHEPDPPAWPDGVSVRTFNPGQDEQVTFETFEAGFRDHWSSSITYESFMQMTEAASFDPSLWYLAFDGDEPIGICFSKLIDGAGWIEDVGVRPPWRRRGVGLALLQHAFRQLHMRGATSVGLSVDAESSTDAPRLYETAGMHVTRSYILHQKVLRSGIDPEAPAT